MLTEFRGRTAVITGGASGIGLAYAHTCAALGMNLVLADIEANALQQAVAAFEDRQTPVLGVITDTMRKASIESLFRDATRRFGNIHLLFNNAGVVNGGAPVPIWETSEEDWDWVLGVNLHGVRWGIQTFVPHMIGHGEPGHIVNTASIAAFIPGGGPYGVTKYGVIRVAEVFRPAIILSATALIVSHCHPSGDPTPSPEDSHVTRYIAEAGQLLGIELLDHVIIGDQRWVSLKERGLGFSF